MAEQNLLLKEARRKCTASGRKDMWPGKTTEIQLQYIGIRKPEAQMQ